ncbi:unnamed protein product [Caenorhabditis nigoni]
MPHPKGFNKFYVNGVDMESDDYANVLNFFQASQRGYAVLNEFSISCLCKRDGCNLPEGFTKYLEYNSVQCQFQGQRDIPFFE